MDNEENEIGITCIAMPLSKPQEAARYAFSISSLTSRMSPDRVAKLAEAIKKTQENILSELVLI